MPKINPRKGMQLERTPKPIKFVNKKEGMFVFEPGTFFRTIAF
jgi:hypothetical protein